MLDANNVPIGTYYYDGEGKRVKKVTDTETTVFVFYSGKLVAEYSTATPPASPTVNYTATDMLGSPRVLTNSLGEVVSRRDFLPFGEELYADGQSRTTANKYTISGQDTVRKRFTGYEKDPETQLDFAEARMYENRFGRFTAVDPLLASGNSASPQTFNRFIYVLNNPLAFTDPSGLQVATPKIQGGRWWKPTKGGAPDFQVVQPQGYEPMTERNKNGDLVYTPVGARINKLGDPEFRIRLNELGPMNSKRLTDVRTGKTYSSSITDFQRNGWETIKGEGYWFFHISGVQNAFEPYDVALALTPFKFGVIGKGTTAATETTTRFWSRSAFEGTRIYQRNDIFDPNLISRWSEGGTEVFGTNIQRMATGRSPIGLDGKSVDLHHMHAPNKHVTAC